jgi:hypothetical protein
MEEDRIYEGAKHVWMECGNNNNVPLPLESQIFMERGWPILEMPLSI